MKLVIVTAVDAYHEQVISLFKKAQIDLFSESGIDGYKNGNAGSLASTWFPIEKGSHPSNLFFSFTEEDNIALLFEGITLFNSQLETQNPIRAVVVPIEKYI